MIDRTSVVVGLGAPDLTYPEWHASLVGTPAAADSELSYAHIWFHRVSHRVMRAIFRHESTDGTEGICPLYATRSPGNTRSSSSGVGIVIDTNVDQIVNGQLVPAQHRDDFVRYPSWAEGFRDMAHRLTNPSYPYVKQGAVTIERIIPIWAPSSDNNKPESYIAAVVSFVNARWPAGVILPTGAPRLAIKAGHHNTGGGNPIEHAIVGELAEAYFVAARYQGFEVAAAVPDGPDADDIPGDGHFPGSLFESAQSILWFKPDVYLSCHTQGGPQTPGMFGIHPDWGDDVDTDARDTLIPAMVDRMTAASGIGQWTDGVMSEQQTFVGSQGFRLGEFSATATLKASCTRIIFEHGAHDVPADLVKLQNSDIQRALAQAGIEAIAEFLDWPLKPWDAVPETAPVSGETVEVPGVGAFKVYGGVYEAWKRAGALNPWAPGYPLNEEHDAIASDAVREQDFQRGRAEWAPGRYPDNHDVTWALVNVELIEAREELKRAREEIARLRTPLAIGEQINE